MIHVVHEPRGSLESAGLWPLVKPEALDHRREDGVHDPRLRVSAGDGDEEDVQRVVRIQLAAVESIGHVFQECTLAELSPREQARVLCAECDTASLLLTPNVGLQAYMLPVQTGERRHATEINLF